jgi:hypothetical protein
MLVEPSPAATSGASAWPSGGWAGSLSRFLTDRTEAKRAYALAEQLGSVNAAAAELDTAWPSLRKAFSRHGLGMPARNPKAVRQRAIAAASRRAGPPQRRRWTRCSWPLTRASSRRRAAFMASRVCGCAAPRRAAEIETLSYRTVVELNADSRLAPQRRVAAIARRPGTRPSPGRRSRRAPPSRAGRPHRLQQPSPPARREGDAQRCPIVPPRLAIMEGWSSWRRIMPDRSQRERNDV